MISKIIVFLFMFYYALGQIPCDDAYGANCPEASGWDVSSCLKALDQSQLSQGCINYLELHDACRSDIDQHCQGKEFTGDLLVCLTEWTKPDVLSASCVDALPKKEKSERKLSEKEKKKAEARRKTRKAAEKLARTQEKANKNNKNEKSTKKAKKVIDDDDEYDDDL